MGSKKSQTSSGNGRERTAGAKRAVASGKRTPRSRPIDAGGAELGSTAMPAQRPPHLAGLGVALEVLQMRRTDPWLSLKKRKMILKQKSSKSSSCYAPDEFNQTFPVTAKAANWLFLPNPKKVKRVRIPV